MTNPSLEVFLCSNEALVFFRWHQNAGIALYAQIS